MSAKEFLDIGGALFFAGAGLFFMAIGLTIMTAIVAAIIYQLRHLK